MGATTGWLNRWHRRSALAATLTLGLLLAACGGTGRSAAPGQPTLSAPRHVTAAWLRSQPGPNDGTYAFRLLDAAGQPVRDWGGVAIKREAAGEGAAAFALTTTRPAADELYLYVVYPAAQLSARGVTLDPARQADYALLAIPRRIQDVLVIGLTRLADRSVPALAGPLLRLSFEPGNDTPFRLVSAVNSDPASAPVLELTNPATPGGPVTLDWDERNIGDYNNNGEVEVADISPIGQLYKQNIAGAPDPQRFVLVDGDGNGEINAADLLPIARNYLRQIDGYTVYRAVGAAPAPEDYSAVDTPTLLRATVFADTPGASGKRLHYTYSLAPQGTTESYIVRAWCNDGTAGVPSNAVTFTATAGNLPPYWVTTVGLTALDGITGGLRLHFGEARDPEGGPVTYLLDYIQGPGPLGAPGTVELQLPPAATAGSAPYSFDLLGLASGTQYTLLLRGADQQGRLTGNLVTSSATVPGLSVSTEPWGAWRGGPARTGSNSAGTIREPLVAGWSQPLQAGAGAPGGPLASAAGSAVVQDAGGIKRFALTAGAPQGSLVAQALPATGAYPALAGARYVTNADAGAVLEDFNSGDLTPYPSPDSLPLTGGPLLIGEYLFGLDTAGQRYSQFVLGGGSAWVQPPTAATSATSAPCSNGSSLFAVLADGALHKHALLGGADEGTGTLGEAPAGSALVYDTLSQRLYTATASKRIAAVKADSLTPDWSIPLAGGESAPCAPVVAHQFAPALVVSAATTAGGDARIVACDPVSGSPAWDVLYPGCAPLSVTAGNARLFVAAQTGSGAGTVLVLHPEDGSLLQRLDGPLPRSEAVPVLGRLLVARQSGGALSLDSLKEDATLPITWNGTTGIKALTLSGTSDAAVFWDPASAPAGLVVRYAIFYSALPAPGPGGPPSFIPPYPATTVIGNLTAQSGAAGYHLSLTPGLRYSVAVRAYYGRWGENAVTDGNTNYLAATAAWYRQPPLDLGTAPPPGGTQLPAGETYLMQGVLDDAGRVHLIYNDEADAHLTHVYQDAGDAWQVESANIGTHAASDFEPRWTNGVLQMAYAVGGKVGLLERTGPDAWADTPFTSNTFTNPQVALAFSSPGPPLGQGALAYTQFLSGSFPNEAGEYNVIRTDMAGVWQPFVTLDSQSYAGRDIALGLGTDSVLQAAGQRGYTYAPNRITPQNGELYFTVDDGLGGYTSTLVDAGDNPRQDGLDTDSSDVGKRVRLALDTANHPHLAYLDLNASPTDPLGQLKYASFDGSVWQIETVTTFDLSQQLFHSLQFTWGELSFALTPAGGAVDPDLPVIGMLARRSANDVTDEPHRVIPVVWRGLSGGGWQAEQLDDELDAYPNDREPCVLLLTPTAWHYFLCTTRDVSDPGAKRIAYYKREL